MDNLFEYIKELDRESFFKVTSVLKEVMVRNKDFENAVRIKETEDMRFPIPDKHLKEYDEAERIELVCRMVGIGIEDLRLCWVLNKAIVQYNQLKEEFTIREASSIVAESNLIFKR